MADVDAAMDGDAVGLDRRRLSECGGVAQGLQMRGILLSVWAVERDARQTLRWG